MRAAWAPVRTAVAVDAHLALEGLGLLVEEARFATQLGGGAAEGPDHPAGLVAHHAASLR
jgi:hypothetical protein